MITAAADRPNVLFVMTDQQYGGALSALMGRRHLDTPNLDRLAGTGLTFTRAYAANPRCVPSRCSIFTGYFPHQTGIQENEFPGENALRFPLMGRYFSEAGYETAYFGKFHIPVEDRRQRGFQIEAHLNSSGEDQAATDDALSFLRRKRDRPFLLTVSFCNPHNICEYGRNEELPDGVIGAPPQSADYPPPPPNPDLPRGECDAMVEQKALRRDLSEYRILESYTPDDWRRYRWAYYRLIEKVDAQIGLILDALRAAGLERNTLVVFTSDHGECAGAHGFSEKVVFYEEAVRVPLILSWPGRIRPERNAFLVNTGIDLLPTLLDFAGISRPADFPGRSLQAAVGATDSLKWRSAIVVENLMEAGPEKINGRMVLTTDFKYCVFDRGRRNESLFDQVRDPLETMNLAYLPAYAQQVTRARELLREHAQQYGDPVAIRCLDQTRRP